MGLTPLFGQLRGLLKVHLRPACRDHLSHLHARRPVFSIAAAKSALPKSPRDDDLEPVHVRPRPPRPAVALPARRSRPHAVSGSQASRVAAPHCRTENTRPRAPGPRPLSGIREDKLPLLDGDNSST